LRILHRVRRLAEVLAVLEELDRAELGCVLPDAVVVAGALALDRCGHEVRRQRHPALDDVDAGHGGDRAEPELLAGHHLHGGLRGAVSVSEVAGRREQLAEALGVRGDVHPDRSVHAFLQKPHTAQRTRLARYRREQVLHGA
jgi:hypothetical protein